MVMTSRERQVWFKCRNDRVRRVYRALVVRSVHDEHEFGAGPQCTVCAEQISSVRCGACPPTVHKEDHDVRLQSPSRWQSHSRCTLCYTVMCMCSVQDWHTAVAKQQQQQQPQR